MTPKTRRHSLIRSLVSGQAVENQEQVQKLLERSGVRATQGTISRDLRELGVIKGPRGYMLPEDAGEGLVTRNGRGNGAAHLDQNVMRSFVHGIEPAGTMVVLKTGPGRASVVALELDGAGMPDVVGTLAGDDTIFLATRTTRSAERVAGALRHMAGLM